MGHYLLFYCLFFWKNGNSYQRACLQVFVAFVVTLPSSISSPLPQWSSEKVNNNLERINVTNKENTHTRRGKQQFHIYFRWDMYSTKSQLCIFGFYWSEMGQFEWLCFALWERKETWSSQIPKPAQTLKTLLLLQITHYHFYIKRASKFKDPSLTVFLKDCFTYRDVCTFCASTQRKRISSVYI